MGEVASCLRYYGGWADKIHGQVINTSPTKLAYTIREPIGVCGQIIPWNYPAAMTAWVFLSLLFSIIISYSHSFGVG
jgi:aldehyde dehydrogenase (NAD+)